MVLWRKRAYNSLKICLSHWRCQCPIGSVVVLCMNNLIKIFSATRCERAVIYTESCVLVIRVGVCRVFYLNWLYCCTDYPIKQQGQDIVCVLCSHFAVSISNFCAFAVYKYSFWINYSSNNFRFLWKLIFLIHFCYWYTGLFFVFYFEPEPPWHGNLTKPDNFQIPP